MNHRDFQRTILIVLLLAAILRVAFVFSDSVLPVMWDTRRYVSGAIGLLSYVDDSGPKPSSEDPRQDRVAYWHYYQKYIQGEQIDWLHYRPYRLSVARDELFVAGPLYPSFLALVFTLSPWEDFTVARLAGVAMDLAALLLLMLLGMRLVDRAAAAIAGALYAVYFPLILVSASLLLETSTLLLTVAAIYLAVRAGEEKRWGRLIWSGVCLGLLILNKPTASLLWIPLIGAYAWYHRKSRKMPLNWSHMVRLAGPVLAVLVVWLSITTVKYGQPALRDPSYAGINLRQSSSIEFEGYDRDEVEPEFEKQTAYKNLASRLPEYVGLFAKKMERMYGAPANDFGTELVWPRSWDSYLHVTILVAGFVGLWVILLLAPGAAAWLWGIGLYYTAVHLVFHSLSRYNLMVMPVLMLATGYVLARVGVIVTSGRPGHVVWSALLILTGLLLPVGFWTWVGTGMSAIMAWASVSLKCVLVLAGMVLSMRELLPHEKSRRLVWVAPAVLAACFVMFWSATLSRQSWAENSTELDSNHMAGTRIYASRMDPVGADDLLVVAVDINSQDGSNPRFELALNGRPSTLQLGTDPLMEFFYPKETYPSYARFEHKGLHEFRQYAVVRLDPDSVGLALAATGYFDIQVRLAGHLEGRLFLYGTLAETTASVFVPSPRHTSVERHVHRGDPRIRRQVEFSSDSSISYYIERQSDPTLISRDSAGTVNGRFNIYVIHFKRNGQILFY